MGFFGGSSGPISTGSNPPNVALNTQLGIINNTGSELLYNGSKNYITYCNFENNASTGWVLGQVGTLTNSIPTGTPTFAGAVGTYVFGTTATNPLEGTYSLALTAVSSFTANDMIATQAYSIDIEDQAKVLTWKFYYRVSAAIGSFNFSGTSSNSLGIAIWDATNSVWLSSTANFGMTQSSGVGYATGTVQTGATTASLNFCIYITSAVTGGPGISFDGFYLGPQTAPIGAPVTDWVSYTPTFTSFGTVATSTFYSRRNGGNLEVTGKFTTGTNTAVPSQISIGFQGANANVTIDTTRISPSTLCGKATRSGFSANNFGLSCLVPSANQTFINIGAQNTSTSEQAVLNGNGISTAEILEVQFSVPIVGWQSNVQMSTDTDTRVVGMVANTSTTAGGATTRFIFTNSVLDTHGAYNSSSGVYTVPVTGTYQINASIGVTSLSNVLLQVRKNGSVVFGSGPAIGGSVQDGILVNGIWPFNAGDTIDIVASGSATATGGATGTYFMVSRLSGPSVIAATESVNMRYHASATTISGSLATVVWTTKDFDSHNAMNAGTGVYTCPVSGKYQVNCAVITGGTFSLNNSIDLQIQKNGSVWTEQTNFAFASATDISVNAGDIIQCNAGDTIQAQLSSSAVAPTISASNSKNWISIARIGN